MRAQPRLKFTSVLEGGNWYAKQMYSSVAGIKLKGSDFQCAILTMTFFGKIIFGLRCNSIQRAFISYCRRRECVIFGFFQAGLL